MSPNKNAVAAKTDFTGKIWNFFTSLKLVIFLLLILAVLSIAGTIIEQNKPLRDYYRFFQPETVDLLQKLGLLDMYHSWWFISCLALLALNIIACTMDRYPAIMAGLRKKNLFLDESLEKTLNVTKIKYALPLEIVEKRILELVAKNFSGKPVITQEDGARHFFFEKGKYSRLAFFFTHLSVLMIFIGALIGSLAGYKGYVNIHEGEGISRVDTRAGDTKHLDFTVKCYKFDVEFYPDGMPKDYRSDLAVIKDGREVVRKTIRVNDPLSFAGITFYQSSYGSLPETALIEIRNKDGVPKGEVEASFGKMITLPGGEDKIEVMDYQEHFHLPDGSEGGPTLGVNLYRDGQAPAGLWLPEQLPEYDKMRHGDYYLTVKSIKLKKYTGLQVNKDPGEWVVWLACLLLIAGIMIAFFVAHKKFWVSLRKDKKGRIEVAAGGTTNKNRAAFTGEVEGMINGFREVAE